MVLDIKQNKTVRDKNYIRIINKKIQAYIKNPFGSLNLIGLPINKLPRGLVVKGTLYMSDNKISELPDDIKIHGDLWCRGTLLNEKYSKIEIRKKYNIKGDIYGNFKD